MSRRPRDGGGKGRGRDEGGAPRPPRRPKKPARRESPGVRSGDESPERAPERDERARGGRSRAKESRGKESPPAATAPEGLVVGYHAVRTALEQDPRRVDRLMLAAGRRDSRTRHLVALAREQGVPFRQVPGEALERLAGGLRHQGVAARLSGTELLAEDELLEALGEDALVLVLDGLEDPRNLGAILRSAAALGVEGVFLPGWRSVGVTPAATRVAAGGAELVRVARAGNVGDLLDALGERGLLCVALDPEGGVPAWSAPLGGGVAIVAGGEEKGLRPGVLKRVDKRVSIPVRPEIASLNVSVAVGMVLHEVARQRAGGDAQEPWSEPRGRD